MKDAEHYLVLGVLVRVVSVVGDARRVEGIEDRLLVDRLLLEGGLGGGALGSGQSSDGGHGGSKMNDEEHVSQSIGLISSTEAKVLMSRKEKRRWREVHVSATPRMQS
jgi:hypothetical protein